MRRVRIGVVAGVVAFGLIVPLATAEAGTPTVLQAISAAERSVKSSPAFQYLLSHTKTFHTSAGRKAALPRVEAVGKLYADISHYVAESSASTATQKTARMTWALGAQLGSQEYAALGAEFRELAAGNSTAALASDHQALALAKRASFDIDKADKLLGLPAGT